MIDVHSHLIPGVDDGSRNIEESVKLMKEASMVGFTDVFLTSHFLDGYYEVSSQELLDKKALMEQEIVKNNINLKLHSGREVYISQKMEEFIKEKKLLPLANSRYMLMELPLNSTVTYLDYVVYCMQSMGLQPVLAHPERYQCVQKNPDLVKEYIEKGILIQSNYASILGWYGKGPKSTIKKLLKKDVIHFLGSDCHRENTIYPLIPKAIKKITKIIGKEKFEEISTQNPQKILENKEWEWE